MHNLAPYQSIQRLAILFAIFLVLYTKKLQGNFFYLLLLGVSSRTFFTIFSCSFIPAFIQSVILSEISVGMVLEFSSI